MLSEAARHDLRARLRDNNRVDYLAALLHGSDAYLVLRAFHAEVNAIQFRVRDPMAGEIRLQWWRDVLTTEGAASTGDVLADALSTVRDTYNWDHTVLLAKIDAHEADLYADPFPDTNAFEGYAGETRSVLFMLHAITSGAQHQDDLATAAGHAGVIEAAADALRAHPTVTERGRPAFPVGYETPIEFAFYASAHLAKFRGACAGLSKESRVIFKRTAVDELMITGVASGRLDAMTEERPPELKSLWRLWRA